jgi:probable DNA repair protein
MSSQQEETVWADIVRDEQHLPTTLDASVQRLASLAAQAYELLCSYSPRHLRTAARAGWDRDAGTFSQWLIAFDEACQTNNLLSASRMPWELIPRLQAHNSDRPPFLAVGFDRLTPIQREIFDVWGTWRQPARPDKIAKLSFHSALGLQSELEACAFWCNRQIAVNPAVRLLVVTQDIASRRGEIERAFLQFGNHAPNFEFSLGIPLAQIPLAHGAWLFLRWLNGTVDESELDWLISSGLAASAEETAELQVYMRVLRQKGLQRTQWTLQAFMDQPAVSVKLPQPWIQRTIAAQRSLRDQGARLRCPIEWADAVPHLLETVGWPGERAQESADFQANRRWQQALDTAGSLGFDGRRMDWHGFLAALDRAMRDTLYAPESLNAPIQIAGPTESAGLTADGIWFLGANEGSWPAVGSTHPFLPLDVQREAAMPHASPLKDWELSSAITKRLAVSAPVVHFSFAEQTEGVDNRPSRLISKLVGAPQRLPADMVPPAPEAPTISFFPDLGAIPFRPNTVHGGSSVLTHQSQCPFKAFARARLGADDWNPAEVGLTPAQRGQILHSILRSIWSGPPDGILSHQDLISLENQGAFVGRHVRKAIREEVPAAILERTPSRYLELEELRLARLVNEWLKYEAERFQFSVAGTEVDRTINLAGLVLRLRIDRIDRLNDGSLLVIDYKTGDVSPKTWELPRPDDVQLPLYAGFGLEESPGGLVFAKLRAFDWEMLGSVADARATLRPLPNRSALVKDPLTPEKLLSWQAYIEELARDFVAGHADVDPRDPPKTCVRCGLQTICRIQEPENQSRLEAKDESAGEEARDE